MTRVPAHIRAEIVRLRGERLTYLEIAHQTGVHRNTVQAVCADYYSSQIAAAQAALRREIHLARSERHTAPLFHPEQWG